MTIEERREIYKEAIEKNGTEGQVIVCIEELSELTKELTKFLRGKGDIERIADEIADVRITVEQMVMIFECASDVASHMDLKVRRLEARL